MSISFTRWSGELAHHYRKKGYWQDSPLTDILTRHADSEHTAVAGDERHLGYCQLNQVVNSLACSLRRQGIRPDETALAQLGNVAELYIIFFTLLKLGVVPVLALFSRQRNEPNAYVKQIEPALLIVDRQHTPSSGGDFLNAFVAEHNPARVVQLRNDESERNLRTTINQPVTDFTTTPSPADEVAYLQPSGGTTGTPKLIPRTHNDYYYNVCCGNKTCHFTGETCYLCAIPAVHNYVVSSPGTLGVFLASDTVVLATNPSVILCFLLTEQHRISVTVLVLPAMSLWLQAIAGWSSNV